MSTQSPFGGRAAQQFPTLPRGDVIGTYDSYPEAQRVVAKLAESDFPVGKLSIVGNDLKTVERVTGKMTYGRAAIAGALSGLWLGFFFGVLLTLFSRQAGGLFFAAAFIGAGFGMLYGIVSFAITKRQRDFTSVHQVLATNYQVICDPQLTGQAQRVLGQAGGPTEHPAWDRQQPWPGPGGFGGQGGAGPSGQGGPGGQPGPYGQGGPGGQPGPYGQSGSPYGGQATPHASQPGQDHRPGGSVSDGRTAPAPQTGTPRYGTNEGPRLGEQPDGASSRASGPDRSDPPRYGERVDGAAPGTTGDGEGVDRASAPASSKPTDRSTDDRS